MYRLFLNRLLLVIFSFGMLDAAPLKAQERFTELVRQLPFSLEIPKSDTKYHSWVHIAVLHPQAPVLRSGYFLGIKNGQLQNATAGKDGLLYPGKNGQLHHAVFDVFDAEGKLIFADAEDCILTGVSFFDVTLDSQYTANVMYHAEVFESLSASPDSVSSGNERSITPFDAPLCLVKNGKSFLWDPIQKTIAESAFVPEKRMSQNCWKLFNGKNYACLEIGRGQLKTEALLDLGDEITNGTFLAKTEKGWGLLNLKGKWMIPPRFNDVFFANDSLLVVLSGGVWKVEEHVRTVTQETSMRGSVYTHEERFVDTVLQGQKAGLYRIDGKKLLSPEYDYILVLNHLILGCHAGAYVSEQNNGLPDIDPRFEKYSLWLSQHWNANPICDVYHEKGKLLYKKSLLSGLFARTNTESSQQEYRLALQVKGKEGLLNDEGKPIVPFSFSAIHFYTGMHFGTRAEVIVAREEGKGIQLYSGEGKLLSEKIFSSAMPVIRSSQEVEMATQDVFVLVMGIGGSGQANSSETQGEEDAAAVVVSREKFVLMDPFGALLTKEPIDELEYDVYYGEFNARVGFSKGRLNLNGIWLVPPVYTQVRPVNNGVFLIGQGELMGLYTNGYELAPEFEQMYWIGSDVFIVVRQGAFGMFDLKSKSFLLEPEFDFIYKLNEQYVLCGKNQKKGIVDYSGNTIVPTEFDALDLAPPGFSADIVRVESNGKIGFFSLSQQKMITAPVLDFVSPIAESGMYFRCLQGGQMEFNAIGELIALRYANYGIVDSTGRIIVPPVYSDVSPFAEDGKIFRAVGPQGEVFFDASGSLISKQMGLERWKQTMLYALGYSPKPTTRTLTQKKGIYAMHPSAFYISATGMYWAGTNGSGVWCSENSGTSWSSCSQGLGNTRVLLLEEFRDTLFCLHHPLYEVNDYFTIAQTANLSYLDKTQNVWIPLERRELDAMGFEIFPFADTLIQHMQFRDSLQRYKTPGQPQLISSFRSDYDYFGESVSSYLPYPDAIQFTTMHGTDTLVHEVPKDIIPGFAGNLVYDGNQAMMLSESGIYRLVDLRSVSVMAELGAESGKISKLLVLGKDLLYALENNSDIWKYRAGKWTKCFDHYSILQKDSSTIFPFPVSSMVASSKDELLFCAAGKVYRMNENDQVETIVGSGKVADLFLEGFNFPEDVFVITHAIEDERHELWCYGFFRNASGENESERLGFFRWNKELKKLEWRNEGLFFAFASLPVFHEKGKLFLENNLIDLFTGDTLFMPAGEFAWDLASTDQLAFAPDGKVAVLLSPQLIAVYDPSQKIWQRIPNFALKLKGIAFDAKGKLYAWTDYAFSAFETAAWKEEQKPLFLAFEWTPNGFIWKEIPKPEGVRMMSFASSTDGTIWLGTDGAGVFEVR